VTLLDDNVHYIREAAPSLGAGILFGQYRWNRLSVEEEEALPPNVVRAVNWAHVDAVLTRLAAALVIYDDEATGGQAGSAAGAAGATASAGSAASPRATYEADTALLVKSLAKPPALHVSWEGCGDSVDAAVTHVRRALELQQTLTLTSAGSSTELLVTVVDRLSASADATVVSLRTGSNTNNNDNSSGGGGAAGAEPRLTAVVRRTPAFLSRRFAPGRGPRFAPAGTQAADGGAGASSAAAAGGVVRASAAAAVAAAGAAAATSAAAAEAQQSFEAGVGVVKASVLEAAGLGKDEGK
jgi:hypothetical protein